MSKVSGGTTPVRCTVTDGVSSRGNDLEASGHELLREIHGVVVLLRARIFADHHAAVRMLLGGELCVPPHAFAHHGDGRWRTRGGGGDGRRSCGSMTVLGGGGAAGWLGVAGYRPGSSSGALVGEPWMRGGRAFNIGMGGGGWFGLNSDVANVQTPLFHPSI